MPTEEELHSLWGTLQKCLILDQVLKRGITNAKFMFGLGLITQKMSILMLILEFLAAQLGIVLFQ